MSGQAGDQLSGPRPVSLRRNMDTEEPTALEHAMAIAMRELPIPDEVDPEVVEAIKTTLGTWVLNTFVVETGPESEDDPEADNDDLLLRLIENAVSCAYIFARITEDVPNQPNPTHRILTQEIIERLLAEGTVTLSLNVE
jgi:hypothetical protein